MNYETKIKALLAAFNQRDFVKLNTCIHRDAEVQLLNGTVLKSLENVLGKWKENLSLYFPTFSTTR